MKRKSRKGIGKRIAAVTRRTRETFIRVRLNVDGTGKSSTRTGVGFLDHMLELFSKHGLFDLEVLAKGDLHVDRHHTNEDVAITLGQAFAKALGPKSGIRRYGCFCLPMEDALVRVALDLSGRPAVAFRSETRPNQKGELYKLEDCEHFLLSLSREAGLNAHVDVLAGRQHHHIIEAVFKAFAKALDQATQPEPRAKGIPSTKGTL